MNANTFPSERQGHANGPISSALAAQRVVGRGELRVSRCRHRQATRLDRLYQQGSAKIRLPKAHGGPLEAVLINTAGGLTGGDVLDWSVRVDDGATAVVTSQASEKLYRSVGGTARVSTRIEVGAGACLEWLPQETILFEQSSMHRQLDVELCSSARLLALESLVLGRKAMGETVSCIGFQERWRIRRDSRLVHADDLMLNEDVIRHSTSPALLSGCAALATLVYVGPETDEQLAAYVKRLRNATCGTGHGISTTNGKIVARVLAKDGYELRVTLIALLSIFRTDRSLPRVWNT